jgi:hypothetical protein
LSFFEDSPAPRRSRSGRGATATLPPDRRTALVRRAVAALAGGLVLVLLVIGIQGCAEAQRRGGLKDYVRDVGALTKESDEQAEALFGLLTDPGKETPAGIQAKVSAARVQATDLVERAKRLGHPDEMEGARRYLVETLEFRRDGLAGISRALPQALADQGRSEATMRIAAQMQNLLTSDVIFSQRMTPQMQAVLADGEVLDEAPVPRSRFLPDIDWLKPSAVAERLSRMRFGGAAPGRHGTSLGAVTAVPGGQALGSDATEIRMARDLGFEVQVQNQGESPESDVVVRVSIGGAGRPIVGEGRVDEIAPNESKTAVVKLPVPPPVDRPVNLDVGVVPVPGEQKTDNNRQSFSAVFTP